MEAPTTVTKEMARAMAEWWGNRVRTITHHDNGDLSLTGLFTSFMADSLNEEVTDSAREKFVDLLMERILEAYEENGRISSWMLTCDYGPSKMLYDVAKEAGISPHNFPWKTHMAVWENDDGTLKVMASGGYRVPWKQIWPEVPEEKIESERNIDDDLDGDIDGDGSSVIRL